MASQISATAAFRLVLKCEITTPILPSGEPLSIVRLVNYILVVFLNPIHANIIAHNISKKLMF